MNRQKYYEFNVYLFSGLTAISLGLMTSELQRDTLDAKEIVSLLGEATLTGMVAYYSFKSLESRIQK